jgi:hypothetical protein
MTHASFWVSVVCICCVAASANAEESPSAAAARHLIAALNAFEPEAIATSDPARPDTFVAALHIPGSQLLVVRQHYSAAEALRQRIALSQFRDVYLDLQGSPAVAGEFFVQDSGADGILDVERGSGAVDVVYEDGVRQTVFNGDFERHHLTRAAYLERLAIADAEYARLLRLLASAAWSDVDAPAPVRDTESADGV